MQVKAGISLLFAAGNRPTATLVEHLMLGASHEEVSARIGHRPPDEHGWIELVASGLTFDLRGLAPGMAAPQVPANHLYGLPEDIGQLALEPVLLTPGPHIASGGATMPVVRTLMRLAATLALELPVVAVCWDPAGAWMDPKYFSRIMFSWLSGGAFPALGLVGLRWRHDGAVESAGLEFFTGQELCVGQRAGEGGPDTMKLAARVIDRLVAHGRLDRAEIFAGTDGEALRAEPSPDGRRVVVSRSA